MFNEPLILSLCGVVRERLLPCLVVVGLMDCIVYTDYVYSAFVSLLADISCLLFLFRKCSFSLFSSSFPPCGSFFFCLWLIGHFVTACLIRAAILHFFFRLHLFTPDTLSSVVLISDLLHQSAAFIFLDGSRVSDWLVRVS